MAGPYTAFTYGDPKSNQEYLVYNTPTFYAGIGISAGVLPPVWGTFDLPDGIEGIAYKGEWYLEGAATPITYSIVSGSLPTGLTLSSVGSAEGTITGTLGVGTAGSYTITIRATNTYGYADQSFTFSINAASGGSGGGGSYTFFA